MTQVIRSFRDVAQSGLARQTGGLKVESSNLSIPTISFFPRLQRTPCKPLKSPVFPVFALRFNVTSHGYKNSA